MPVDNMQVQLVDTPPLSREFVEPALRDLLRKADMLLPVVDLTTEPMQQLRDCIDMLKEFRIAPKHLQDRYDEEQRMVFIPILVLVNKCDNAEMEEVFHIFCELVDEPWPCMPVSAETGYRLQELKWKVIEALDVIRVYTQTPGEEPDLVHPFVLPRGSRVSELAEKIHRDLAEEMKSARVWGEAVHDGQMVPREYELQDGDIVEIVA